MTPNEHDNPGDPEKQGTTTFSRSDAAGYPRAADGAPEVPAMEQLPDPDALPDPGFPEMPAPAGGNASAEDRPRPPAAATFQPLPSFYPGQPADQDQPQQAPRPSPPPPLPQEPQAARKPPPSQQAETAPRPVWPADPYAAPRAPRDAPPLRGPSVPWSQVRAAADYEAEALPSPSPTPPRAQPLPPQPQPQPRPQPPAEPASAGPAAEPIRPPTSAALTSEVLLPGKRATPDGGWRRTVYRATGGLIRIGESPASLRRRDLVTRIRTPTAGGHHRVAVLSLKGGVGKTTATVGLGATLASLRGDRVIAVDGNPDRGTLSDKVRLETPATIRDLLNERALVARYADVRAFTSQAPSRLEILASDRDPGVSVAFSADDYRAVAAVLEHYYSVCVTDCGTGLLHSAMAGILELADQIVLVSSPSVDGARSASATLDWLDAHSYGDLVGDAVVVLSAVRRRSKSAVDLDRLEQHFTARCRALVRVPYDTHLEEGAEFELDYLDPATAEAYLTLAALVADGFARPRRSAASTPAGRPLA
jgi:MinD-like ATPase involved in chromosome partitioning or flagellar assembly